jgi:hypothetical protein
MLTTPNRKKVNFAPGVKKDAKFYLGCFDSVQQHQQYWNKWICDDGWIDIINERFEIPALLKFVSADLNRSIGRSPRFGGIDSLQEYNIHGLFKASYFEQVGTKRLN